MTNKPNSSQIRTSVVMNKGIYEALGTLGEREDRSKHYLIIKAVKTYLEQNGIDVREVARPKGTVILRKK